QHQVLRQERRAEHHHGGAHHADVGQGAHGARADPGQRRQVQRAQAANQPGRADDERPLRKSPGLSAGAFRVGRMAAQWARAASSNSATMLVILIIGFTAGPAVSLYGSPTVSPVTAALCASDPLPPKWPSSMYFLALSQAPPPAVMEMATNRPVTITPSSMAPTAAKASARVAMMLITTNTTIGDNTGSSDGIIISLIAALVSI